MFETLAVRTAAIASVEDYLWYSIAGNILNGEIVIDEELQVVVGLALGLRCFDVVEEDAPVSDCQQLNLEKPWQVDVWWL